MCKGIIVNLSYFHFHLYYYQMRTNNHSNIEFLGSFKCYK